MGASGGAGLAEQDAADGEGLATAGAAGRESPAKAGAADGVRGAAESVGRPAGLGPATRSGGRLLQELPTSTASDPSVGRSHRPHRPVSGPSGAKPPPAPQRRARCPGLAARSRRPQPTGLGAKPPSCAPQVRALRRGAAAGRCRRSQATKPKLRPAPQGCARRRKAAAGCKSCRRLLAQTWHRVKPPPVAAGVRAPRREPPSAAAGGARGNAPANTQAPT